MFECDFDEYHIQLDVANTCNIMSYVFMLMIYDNGITKVRNSNLKKISNKIGSDTPFSVFGEGMEVIRLNYSCFDFLFPSDLIYCAGICVYNWMLKLPNRLFSLSEFD